MEVLDNYQLKVELFLVSKTQEKKNIKYLFLFIGSFFVKMLKSKDMFTARTRGTLNYKSENQKENEDAMLIKFIQFNRSYHLPNKMLEIYWQVYQRKNLHQDKILFKKTLIILVLQK